MNCHCLETESCIKTNNDNDIYKLSKETIIPSIVFSLKYFKRYEGFVKKHIQTVWTEWDWAHVIYIFSFFWHVFNNVSKLFHMVERHPVYIGAQNLTIFWEEQSNIVALAKNYKLVGENVYVKSFFTRSKCVLFCNVEAF